MKRQYIIKENNYKKREEFYNYIVSNYNLKILYPYKKELFINSVFPFVVDFKDNTLWICESITSLACASQNGKIITIKEFKIESLNTKNKKSVK